MSPLIVALSKNLLNFSQEVSGNNKQEWQAASLYSSDADLIPIMQCGSWEQLYLPLIFGFCTHNDQSLPTVAMFNKKSWKYK